MASKFFYGRQKTLRAVRPFTIGFSSGATYTWTVNGKTLIYTAVSGDDATSVALALANLGSSSVEPEHSELEFSSSAAVLTATGPTDGGPFTASGSATAGSFTSGTAITGTSPNDLTDTANWSGAALPGNNDTVTFPKNAPNVRYNLAGMTATGLTIIREAGGPRLGLPDVRSDGKLEYRSTRMVLASCASALIYLDGNEVAQSVRLDCGTFATIVEIVGVGPSAPGAEVVEVVGLTTNGEIRCNNGSVASCTEDGEAEIVTVLNATNSTLRVGPWGTATTINVNGQTAVASIAANFTTLNVDDFAPHLCYPCLDRADVDIGQSLAPPIRLHVHVPRRRDRLVRRRFQVDLFAVEPLVCELRDPDTTERRRHVGPGELLNLDGRRVRLGVALRGKPALLGLPVVRLAVPDHVAGFAGLGRVLLNRRHRHHRRAGSSPGPHESAC